MILTNDNFLLFAAKYYDTKYVVDMKEFYADVKRIQYIKRLFKQYKEKNCLKTRLILNHIIIMYNCFGTAATPILFMKLRDYHEYLKPFVIKLNYMPENIKFENINIITSDIPLDSNIVQQLRNV